jgi:hypothetical protein
MVRKEFLKFKFREPYSGENYSLRETLKQKLGAKIEKVVLG